MSRVDTLEKKDKGVPLDKPPKEEDGVFDPSFFADESRSKTVVGQRFAHVLRLPGWRLPSAEVREWVRNLEALKAGRVRAADRPHLAKVIGAALADHAGNGPLTSWARAVGLVTVLAAHEVPQAAVTGIEPYIGGTGNDLLKPFAEALSAYHNEAQQQQAGPLAFFWLTKAATPFASHFRTDATAAVRAYLDGTPSDDRVGQFLVSQPGRGGDVPSRRDGTRREWVCALFNGRRRGWTRDGLLRLAAVSLIAVFGVVGLAIWVVADSRVEAFRAGQITPMRSALSK